MQLPQSLLFQLPFPPRPYQSEAVINTIENVGNILLLDVKTGGGKTFIYKMLTLQFPTKTFIMSVPLLNLAHQTRDYDSEWGLITGSKRIRQNARVKVYSIIKLANDYRDKKIRAEDIDFLVIDECHRGTKGLESLVKAIVGHGGTAIGMTATPWNGNGTPLSMFENAINIVSKKWRNIKEYVEHGFLTPIIYRSVGTLDYSKIKVVAGEYRDSDIEGEIEDSAIDEVAVLKKYGIGQTLIMCRSVAHANEIFEDMTEAGLSVGILTSKNKTNDLERFTNCEIQFLLSIMMISVGTDIPCCQTCVALRPIRSYSLIDQFIGRNSRLYEGKKVSYFIDVYGCIKAMGRFPFEQPVIDIEPIVKKDPKCKACGEEKSEELVFEEESQGQLIRVCKCNHCGETRTLVTELPMVSCEKCFNLQKLENIYIDKKWSVVDCNSCKEQIKLNQIVPKECVVTFGNIDTTVSLIVTLIKGWGFTINQDLVFKFCSYATKEQISYTIDLLGDFSGSYEGNSVEKMQKHIEKMIGRLDYFVNESEYSDEKLLMSKMIRNDFVNRNIDDFALGMVQASGLDFEVTMRGIGEEMFSNPISYKKIGGKKCGACKLSWSKRYGMNEKKIKSLIKSYVKRKIKLSQKR